MNKDNMVNLWIASIRKLESESHPSRGPMKSTIKNRYEEVGRIIAEEGYCSKPELLEYINKQLQQCNDVLESNIGEWANNIETDNHIKIFNDLIKFIEGD